MVKWSFSGLKQYINCPKQYHEVKVLQNFQVSVSSQMKYGTDVHKALEDYARDGTELPLFYQRFKQTADTLMGIPGTRYIEHKMALKEDRVTPCGFDDPDYWVRGIVDFMVIDGDTAFIVDYKTGSAKYPDPKQLKLMAIMTFAHFPEVKFIKAALAFILHNAFMDEMYRREEVDKMWTYFSGDLHRLEMSMKTNAWPANATPLCGWCPVKTCKFHDE
jgi:hypothetical protein